MSEGGSPMVDQSVNNSIEQLDNHTISLEPEDQQLLLPTVKQSYRQSNNQSNSLRLLCLGALIIISTISAWQVISQYGYPRVSFNNASTILNSQSINPSMNNDIDPYTHSLLASIQPPPVNDFSAINQQLTGPAKQSVCLSRFRAQFGNHLYQLLLVIRYALKNNMSLHLPPATESNLFPVFQRFLTYCPSNFEVLYKFNALDWNDPTAEWSNENPRVHTNESNFHVMLDGGFQYNTSIYSDDVIKVFRAMLKPDDRLLMPLTAMFNQAINNHCSNSLIVAIHIRHGDYPPPGAQAAQSRIPVEWYLKWLNQMTNIYPHILIQAKQVQDKNCPSINRSINPSNKQVPKLVLFIASDDNDVASQFELAGYTVITSEGLQMEAWGGLYQLSNNVPRYYPDWWMLSRCHVLATSHSSFSLMASLYSEHEAYRNGFFYRPDDLTMSLQPYDPRNFFYHSAAFRGKNFTTVPTRSMTESEYFRFLIQAKDGIIPNITFPII